MTKMFKMTFSSPHMVKIAEIAIFKVLEQKHCFTDFMPPKNPKKRDQILSKSRTQYNNIRTLWNKGEIILIGI